MNCLDEREREFYIEWWLRVVADDSWRRFYGKISSIVRGRLRSVLCRNVMMRTELLIGCSRARLMIHIESLFQDGMNWGNHGKVWELDHIVPICRFDLDRREQLVAACHWTNFAPLFRCANRKKGARVNHQPELPMPVGFRMESLTRAQILGADISDQQFREKLIECGGVSDRNAAILKIDVWYLSIIVNGVHPSIPVCIINRLPWLNGMPAFNPDFEKAPTFDAWSYCGLNKDNEKSACIRRNWKRWR